MKNHKMVQVEWIDSATFSRWHEIGGDDCPAAIRTVGMKVKSDRKYIVVALSQDEWDKCSDVIAIPRASIKSIKELKWQ